MRFVILLVCLLLGSSAAHAQSLPGALLLRSSALEPVDPELRLRPLDRALVHAPRHRLVIASGIGALTAATVHGALLGNFGGCGRAWPESVSRRELLMAGAVGVVGMTFVIGGSVGLARVPKAAWRSAGPGEKIAAVFTALASAAAAEALLITSWGVSDSCF
jgi:hypothetical protein